MFRWPSVYRCRDVWVVLMASMHRQKTQSDTLSKSRRLVSDGFSLVRVAAIAGVDGETNCAFTYTTLSYTALSCTSLRVTWQQIVGKISQHRFDDVVGRFVEEFTRCSEKVFAR